MPNQVRLADYVLAFVANQGVKHVFLVPGGGAMHLNDALAQNSSLEFVPNHHEQASAIAAEAYARVSERLGVAMVTTGPGGTNALTGVVGAWIESVPLLIISGQVKRADLIGETGVRQRGPQEVDIVALVSPVTKYAVTITEPLSIRYHLEKALYLATSGRKGPVWIDIPLDVQATMIDTETLAPFSVPLKASPSGLDSQVVAAINLLNQAQRPLILAGHGVRLAGAAEVFRLLYEKLSIPVVTTWNAMDLIPANHRLSIGRPGAVAQRPPNFAVQNCDLLIAIGARLDNVVTAFNPAKFGRQALKILVDVDPPELSKFDMPIALSICADANDFIQSMLKQAEALQPVVRDDWLNRCASWKVRYPVGEGKPVASSGAISHYDLVRVLSEEIPENTLIVTGSSGLAIEMFYTAFQNKSGQRIFLTSGLGAMGYGLPAMLGAGMASRNASFVGIESDGSLQMNLQELLTIKEFNLPVRIFVMNNKGYASIRATQRNHFQGRYIGTGPESRLLIPDLLALAHALQIPAIRIGDASELREKVRHTINQPGPFICDVSLIADELLWPKCQAMQQPDGSMVSMPLEDMWPLLPRDELRENMIGGLDPVSERISVQPV
jgi:acetolactate synthase-1/2/3 large subunit